MPDRRVVVTTCQSVSIRLILDVSKIRKCDQNMDEKPFFLRQQFSDFEAYCESARHWDLDYNQLDCGDFTSERLMFGNESTIFSHTKIGRRMLQKGTTPAGLVTFGVLANPKIGIHWRNHDICGDKLFIFPPSGELHSVTQPDFNVFALSLSEETLDRTCRSLELPDFSKMVDGNEVFKCHPQSMLLLREWLQKTALGLTSSSPTADSNIHLHQLEEELARRLVSTLAESRKPIFKPAMRRRDRALKTALDFITESDEPITSVRKLCIVAHVSERTLEYAFRERLGLSPKTFTVTIRLNNVRKMLTYADPDVDRIHKIAGQHGFFHMGQFSASYKRLFGEQPSVTLNRL